MHVCNARCRVDVDDTFDPRHVERDPSEDGHARAAHTRATARGRHRDTGVVTARQNRRNLLCRRWTSDGARPLRHHTPRRPPDGDRPPVASGFCEDRVLGRHFGAAVAQSSEKRGVHSDFRACETIGDRRRLGIYGGDRCRDAHRAVRSTAVSLSGALAQSRPVKVGNDGFTELPSLPLHLVGIPAQLGREHRCELAGRGRSCFCSSQYRSGAAREEVVDGERHLVAGGPDRLHLQVGQPLYERFKQVRPPGGNFQNLGSFRAVAAYQGVHRVSRDSEVVCHPGPGKVCQVCEIGSILSSTAVGGRSDELQMSGARFGYRHSEDFDRGVDGLFGHQPVGGHLAASDGDDSVP